MSRIYWWAVEPEPVIELRGGPVLRWMRDTLHLEVVEIRPPEARMAAGIVYLPLSANTFGLVAGLSEPHRAVILDVHAPFWSTGQMSALGLDGLTASPDLQARQVVEWSARSDEILNDVQTADVILTPHQEWADVIASEYNPFVVVAPDVKDPTTGFEFQRAFARAVWQVTERREANWQRRWARQRPPWWWRTWAAAGRPIMTYSIAKFMEREANR